jgi:hypothetical protein
MLLLVNVHPGEKYLRETLHTLGFGTNARQVTRGAPKHSKFAVHPSNSTNNGIKPKADSKKR